MSAEQDEKMTDWCIVVKHQGTWFSESASITASLAESGESVRILFGISKV